MHIFTIGFTQKSAQSFFGALRHAGVKRIVDVRLNNRSQLAGFAKARDLPWLLDELASIEYVHDICLSPTPQLLASYRAPGGNWESYSRQFLALIEQRKIERPRYQPSSTTRVCCVASIVRIDAIVAWSRNTFRKNGLTSRSST